MDEEPDLDRYDSAAGWEPKDQFRQLREWARSERRRHPTAFDTMIQARPAGKWRSSREERADQGRELFGPMWRSGELAVLLGDKGSGKSLLAVQIAESLARGTPFPGPKSGVHSASPARHAPLKVLYFDFQRTAAQWNERYTDEHSGKRTNYRFSRDLIRAAIDWDGDLPDCFRGDLNKFLRHSIHNAIVDSGAKVVIIDDLTYISHATSSAGGAVRAMRTLRLEALMFGLSILVLMPAKPKDRPAPASVKDVLGSRLICQQADSVFSLCRSTFGPEYRYLIHLASPQPIINDAQNTLSIRLKRRRDANWNIENTGQPALLTEDSLADPSLIPHPSSLIPPPPANCFLGFEILGPSEESDHLRDYSANAYRIETESARRERLRDPGNVVEMLMSPEYGRYLKGE